MVARKAGFSLAEALVVMTIVAIFFAFASKVITTKQKPQSVSNPHGFFECYLDGGNLMQARANENAVGQPQNANGTCVFEPPKGAAFFNVNTYGDALYTGYEPNANVTVNIEIPRTSEQFIVIRNENNEEYVIKPDGALTQAARVDAQGFFKSMYPHSNITNEGNFGRQGIIISW